MDKLTIVMSNYIDVECDANTTPRQAYERGFRRAAEKCETVMRSRKAKNDALESENAKLREERREYQATIDSLVDECTDNKAENAKLRELCRDMFTTISWCNLDCYPSDNKKREYVDRLRELEIEVDE